jgi:hypothetical protein
MKNFEFVKELLRKILRNINFLKKIYSWKTIIFYFAKVTVKGKLKKTCPSASNFLSVLLCAKILFSCEDCFCDEYRLATSWVAGATRFV